MTITSDDEILGGEPRIDGTRIGVRHVAGKVIDGGYSPAYVADQLDVPLAAIYGAMAYYYENIEQIRAFEREHADAFERVREESLKPKESISWRGNRSAPWPRLGSRAAGFINVM